MKATETTIDFLSDGVSIRGPKQDGSGSVTFEVGEYELGNIAGLLALGKNYVLTVSVAVGDEIDRGKKKPLNTTHASKDESGSENQETELKFE